MSFYSALNCGSNKPLVPEFGVTSDSWQVMPAVLGVVMLVAAFALMSFHSELHS